jgi:hypothetical protein
MGHLAAAGPARTEVEHETRRIERWDRPRSTCESPRTLARRLRRASAMQLLPTLLISNERRSRLGNGGAIIALGLLTVMCGNDDAKVKVRETPADAGAAGDVFGGDTPAGGGTGRTSGGGGGTASGTRQGGSGDSNG